MHTAPSSTPAHGLQALALAMAHAPSEERLDLTLNPAQWDILQGYLLPHRLPGGQILFARGVQDRTLYFIESGGLSVHLEDDKGRLRLALVGAGSVVGEGAFFSHLPRSATVQASADCQLWALTALRFAELGNRQPAMALSLSLGLGALMARRFSQRRRRVACT
ncbi:cyclic nucleotide-binding domain-containing protein [Curvibacter sp. RS43]|uniref:Crp/Fnr family transcriptional regulator n=1 Tax=Curvibacter microcysteis TaxID=3026419 RepID=UPI002360CFE4|nr:cyclic nucleotide-binding domain-containing protein [Curvibacter sp. RS43]MDD0811032.1 cyclic nucleotide-binding domain-containing protein [Curvibacter sp. RS43]